MPHLGQSDGRRGRNAGLSYTAFTCKSQYTHEPGIGIVYTAKVNKIYISRDSAKEQSSLTGLPGGMLGGFGTHSKQLPPKGMPNGSENFWRERAFAKSPTAI
ncbi:MAG: hypothetical protein HGA56_09005 [Chlorobiaceae bacterium]|nr:hypothetical protein [Chlorobiaceae bacterium]